MAMLRHRAAHPDARITAHVLVSARSATAALYTTELETLTPRERLHVARTYTRQAPAGWRGWTRRVDDAMLRAAGPPDPAARVFVCGATPFVGTVTRLLVDQGHDPRAIRVEDFGTEDAEVRRAAGAREPTGRAGEDARQRGAG
jgi:ferredoxin-NADP reductase